jgi:hypothetical protein
MSELAPEIWHEIARQYTAGVAVAVIARAFKVSRARIKRKAEQLGWTRAQANDDVVPRMVHSGSSKAGTSAVASAAHRRSVLIERHRAAWDEISAVRQDAYRLLRGEEPQIIKDLATGDVDERLSRAARLLTMVDKDTNSLMRAQEGQRRAYGFDYKQQEAETKEDEAALEQRAEMVDSILELADDFTRRKAYCRCQPEGGQEPVDTVSQSAPEISQDPF